MKLKRKHKFTILEVAIILSVGVLWQLETFDIQFPFRTALINLGYISYLITVIIDIYLDKKEKKSNQ